MLRLKLTHLALRALGLYPQYVVRLVVPDAKRLELRGRTLLTTDDPGEASALWTRLNQASENPRGLYYIAVETKLDTHLERRTPGRSAKDIADNGPEPGGLFGGLPQATQGGPTAAHPQETDDAEQARTDGAGAVDRHDLGAEASAESEESVGLMGPTGPAGPTGPPGAEVSPELREKIMAVAEQARYL